MKLFVNKQVRRIYLFAYLLLFITLIINLFLESQIQNHYQKVDSSKQALINQSSLQCSIKNATGIFVDIMSSNHDNIERDARDVKKDIYSSFERVKENTSFDSENLESLKKIEYLIGRSIAAMNKGLKECKKDNNPETVSAHLQETTKLIKQIDQEISSLQKREEMQVNTLIEKKQAAFKFSTPTTFITVMIISVLTVFSLIMTTEKNEEEKTKKEKTKRKFTDINAESNEELINTIVHEIKNPLNNIIMACDLSDPGIPPETTRNIVKRNSYRIYHLVNELLSSSKTISTLKLRKISTKDLIEEVLLQVEPKINYLNIRLITHFQDNACNIYVDAEKVKIVLLNIILNAIEAMNKEVKILSIATKCCEDYCCIEISDNGVGMSKSMLKKIFDPHFTSKKNGSGLGLTNSKKLIQRLGGKIEVSSQLRKGSVFTIVLQKGNNILR